VVAFAGGDLMQADIHNDKEGRHSAPDLFGWTDWPPDNHEQQYPDAPGFKEWGASRDAALAIAPAVPALQDRVLRLLKSLAPDECLTADEIAIRLQRSILSIRPRVSELAVAGKIVRTDQRGKNESGMTACKWRAS
jgi:hypothetical protein